MTRVTTYDIALACGVSQATVDRALNNRSNIKKETRDLILRTAAEMNYRPSNLPTYLKTGKTQTIGIIVPKAGPFYTELLGAETKAAKMRNYHAMISFSEFNYVLEGEYLSGYLKTNVDGIIVFPVTDDGSEIKKIIQAGVPVVTLIRKIKNYNLDFVSVNYARAAEKAIQYMIDMGHRKIGYFTIWDKSSNLYTYNERLRGIENAMKKNGLAIDPKHIICDTEDYQLVHALALKRELPTALLCFNDLNAIGLISFLNSLDLKVPGDISLVSFDNIDMLRYFNPGITSISYPYDDIAETAIHLLLDRIENPSEEATTYLLETQMVRRNSCRRMD